MELTNPFDMIPVDADSVLASSSALNEAWTEIKIYRGSELLNPESINIVDTLLPSYESEETLNGLYLEDKTYNEFTGTYSFGLSADNKIIFKVNSWSWEDNYTEEKDSVSFNFFYYENDDELATGTFTIKTNIATVDYSLMLS